MSVKVLYDSGANAISYDPETQKVLAHRLDLCAACHHDVSITLDVTATISCNAPDDILVMSGSHTFNFTPDDLSAECSVGASFFEACTDGCYTPEPPNHVYGEKVYNAFWLCTSTVSYFSISAEFGCTYPTIDPCDPGTLIETQYFVNQSYNYFSLGVGTHVFVETYSDSAVAGCSSPSRTIDITTTIVIT